MAEDEDYIIEFITQGRFVRVTAVDPVTGTEAVIVGDPSRSRKVLMQAASEKLNFLLKKQSSSH